MNYGLRGTALMTTGDRLPLVNPPSRNTEWIARIEYLGRQDIGSLAVWPEPVIQRVFEEITSGYPETRYLGLHTV